MLRPLLIILSFLLSVNVFEGKIYATNTAATGSDSSVFYKSIRVSKVKKLIAKNENNQRFVILDVRSADDFKKDHIANAINIDYKAPDLLIKLDELDRSKVYLVYCYGGFRSKQTMQLMKDKNFTSVYNMKGGMMKWKVKGYPVVNGKQ